MRIGNLYRDEIFSVLVTDQLSVAARRMHESHVGALAVYEGDQLAGKYGERPDPEQDGHDYPEPA